MDSYLGEGARAGPASADLLLLHFLQNLLAAMVALGLGEQSLLTHAAQAAQAVASGGASAVQAGSFTEAVRAAAAAGATAEEMDCIIGLSSFF